LEHVRRDGVTPHELAKAKNQLRARLVFENDSISNIAHQLGFFQTIGSWREYPPIPEAIGAVTLEQVADVARARLDASNRTVGWFEPLPAGRDGVPR
jgi:zinc protease